ncbi:MAG: hypothetical protein K0S32_1947 [Bacteroidetes bacterium]|jgi:hypothetical protein|nr:hypothetical protein [Bacteroidota bacterium]
MKRIIIVSTLFLFIVSFTSFKTKEELWLRGLAENVKSNDLKKFRGSVITQEEFALLVNNSTWSPEKKESMKNRMTQAFLDEKSLENFKAINTKVNDNKILWAKTVVDSVKFDLRKMDGLDEMKFTIYLSQDKRRYKLSGDKCLKTQLGWKLSNGVTLSVDTPTKK